MSDIKERLRQRTADYVEHICSRPTDHEALEAADEIERLERELAEAREHAHIGRVVACRAKAERDGAEIARLRETITSLQTVMVAAAEELHEHWAAHCDADGYGPSNLMTRLEHGIAAQYLYKAGDFARLHASLADLAADRDAALAALAEAQRDAERYRLMRRNPTVDGESLVVVEVLEFNEDGPTDVYYAHAGDPLDAAIDAAIAKEQSHASE